jgi:hypothetical protein
MLSLNRLKGIIIYNTNNLINKWAEKLINTIKTFFIKNPDVKMPAI